MFHVKHSFVLLLLLQTVAESLMLFGRKRLFSSLPVYWPIAVSLYCLAKRNTCTLSLGDCDSTKCDVYSAVAAQGATVEIFPQAKDDTDLQLLLKNAEGSIFSSAVFGVDASIIFSAKIYSLLQYKLQHHCQVILADEQECMVLLDAYEEVEAVFAHPEQIEALSVLPLADTNRVSIANVVWPFK